MGESYGKVPLVTDVGSLLDNLNLYSLPIDEISKKREEIELQKAKLERKVNRIAEDYIREVEKAKRELNEKDKELAERDSELNGYFSAIQGSIDTWIELAAKKLYKRNEEYQTLKRLRSNLEGRDPNEVAFLLDLVILCEEYSLDIEDEIAKDNRGLNSGLKLLRQNYKEIEKLEEEISAPISIAIIIKPIEDQVELYLPALFCDNHIGLINNLIDYVKECLPKEAKWDPFHHCGATKVITGCDYNELSERLLEKTPEEFEEANLKFTVINVRNVHKKKKSSHNGFLKIIKRKK